MNLTNADGEVTKTYKYDAFGVEKDIVDSDTNAFRYCGEYYDAETGTIYLRARYYNPSTGRFISRDSYAGKNEDPLSLNLYTYCANNPIVNVDPDGHFWHIVAGGVIGGILGAGSQLIGNIVSGQKWYDGLGSAAIGGAVGGAVFAGTGSMAASSYAGAAAQSISSESWQYISGKKKLTSGNVLNSLGSIVTETAVNGTTSLVLGKGMDKLGSFLSKTNIGSKLSNTVKNIKSKAMLKLCSGNDGFGFKFGNTEVLYKNQNVGGGTFISTKNSSTGFRCRVEWDTQYGLHYHYRPRSGVTTKNHMPIRSTFIVPSVRNKK